MIYYIGDLHIGHEHILKLDNRPYNSMLEMTRDLVNNWNSVVTSDDDVYVIGDMFWKPAYALETLPKLNGRIHLIKGNHDKLNDEVIALYTEVKDYMEIIDSGHKVVLCHYPLAHWNGQNRGSIHIFAHIHMGRDTRPFAKYREFCLAEGIPFECYNVGCMLPYMGFTPRTLKYLQDYGMMTAEVEGYGREQV